MESGREQPPHILHEEHPGLYNLYKPKELPKECPARILDGPPPASRAESLARWTANKQIKFPGFYVAFLEDFSRIKCGNIVFENSKVFGEPPCGTIQTNRLAKGIFLFNAGSYAESSRLFKAEV
jgi:hypothetical protein